MIGGSVGEAGVAGCGSAGVGGVDDGEAVVGGAGLIGDGEFCSRDLSVNEPA